MKINEEKYLQYVLDDIEGVSIDGGKKFGGSTVIYYVDDIALLEYGGLGVFGNREKITNISSEEKEFVDGKVVLVVGDISDAAIFANKVTLLKICGAVEVYAYARYINNDLFGKCKHILTKGTLGELFTPNAEYKDKCQRVTYIEIGADDEEALKDKCRRLQERRNYFVDANKWIIAHIDGRSFSKLVKDKFKKPFDEDFISMMNETAVYLCENVQGAKVAYVQSDEITLLIKKNSPEGDVFFGGRLCKMQSIIASLATSEFNKRLIINKLADSNSPIKDIVNMKMAQFDCKVWDVDSKNDAVAWLLFRNIDCIRNSKQQAAQSWCSHKELLNRHTDEQITILKEKHNVDWHSFPKGQKYGRIIYKEPIIGTAIVDEKEITFERHKFIIHDGFDMTDNEKRDKFINTYIF